jgi:hypothetical protein
MFLLCKGFSLTLPTDILTTTLAATCNVVTSDSRTAGADVEQSIDWTPSGATTNADWDIIAGPGFGTFTASEEFNLMTSGVPDVVSYIFYKPNQINVGSGFVFDFQFKMSSGGAGHGLAVLFHDRAFGLENFNGGSGPNLGIKNNDNSFAIVFDITDNVQQLRVHYNLVGDRRNSVANSTLTVFDPDVIQDWQDDQWHQVNVLYYKNPDW